MTGLEAHWKNFLHGDNHALGNVYSKLFEPLVFKAISYTKDIDQAKDIFSQLFTELISTQESIRKNKWSQVKDPLAFLSVIVRNKSIDVLRKQSNQTKLHNQLVDENHATRECTALEEQLQQLEHCIQKLSDDEKSLLTLHLQGYKNHELAAHFNVAEKTIRNRLSLTRKVLAFRWNQLFTLFLLLWN